MGKLPYFVCWIKYNRSNSVWRPIHKFQRCATIEKAEKLKKNILSQIKIVDVFISKDISYVTDK